MLLSHLPLQSSSYFAIQTLTHPFSLLNLKFFNGHDLGSPVAMFNIKSSIPRDSAPQDISEQEMASLDAFQTLQLSQVLVLGKMGSNWNRMNYLSGKRGEMLKARMFLDSLVIKKERKETELELDIKTDYPFNEDKFTRIAFKDI